jgi:hypothetical protein
MLVVRMEAMGGEISRIGIVEEVIERGYYRRS